MATDLTDLRSALALQTGGTLSDATLDALLRAAVDAYNAEGPQEFEVTGTLLDRDATTLEQRALVLEAALLYASQQAMAAAETAVSSSNVAGRTDLTGVAAALAERWARLRRDLDALMQRLAQAEVVGDITLREVGETYVEGA